MGAGFWCSLCPHGRVWSVLKNVTDAPGLDAGWVVRPRAGNLPRLSRRWRHVTCVASRGSGVAGQGARTHEPQSLPAVGGGHFATLYPHLGDLPAAFRDTNCRSLPHWIRLFVTLVILRCIVFDNLILSPQQLFSPGVQIILSELRSIGLSYSGLFFIDSILISAVSLQIKDDQRSLPTKWRTWDFWVKIDDW